MTQFRLDSGEAFNAAIAGLQRQFRAIQRNAKDNQGDITRDEFSTNIHGAIAEATVAKALGVYCNLASSDRSLPDAGLNIEVRSSPNVNAKMPIRPKDRNDAKFYFVVGIYPDTRIIGWLYGKDCKQDRFWVANDRDGKPLNRPYWAVPQSELNQELIEISL
jgi:hypothetical protein